ncbi:MAG: T9SS type A sorting domain-containing protein [Bacteroidia bacterium]|nr:T9SS type A sorting domain-containing protein [Bacteroidia bacterium]
MRQSAFLICFLLAFGAIQAQVTQRIPGSVAPLILTSESFPCEGNVLFSEDFENGIPSTWEVRDYDSLIPAPSTGLQPGWQSLVDYRDSSNHVAASPSWYLPKGASDDWLISPLVNPTNQTCLSWKAYSQDGNFKESYEVLVATTKDTADFLANDALFSKTNENSDPFYNNVDLSAWAGQSVYIAFHQKSDDKFVLVIDDVSLVEVNTLDAGVSYIDTPAAKALSPVTVKCFIRNYGLETVEDVTLKWSVNGDTVHSMDLDSIGLESGRTYAIAHSAKWTPQALGTFNLCVWTSKPNNLTDNFIFNDTLCLEIEVTEFVGFEESLLGSEVKVYPNPAQDKVQVELDDFHEIKWGLRDLSGKLLRSGKLHSQKTEIDLSGLNQGIYFLQFQSESGHKITRKLIKR